MRNNWPSLLIGLCFSVVTAHAGGDTALHQAAARHYGAKDVQALIAQGADVNARNEYGKTPLHLAVDQGAIAVVELLLVTGADVNARDNLGNTPLQVAAAKGRKEFAELLLAKGADVNAKDAGGKTALHKVRVMYGKSAAEALLANGADVNARDNGRRTPLYEAVAGTDKYHVGLLLANGAVVDADIDTKDKYVSPLWWATYLSTAPPTAIGAADNYAVRREVLGILEEHLIKHERNPRELLRRLTEQLRKDPANTTIDPRRLIVKLASRIKPAPVIPEEARRHFVEGSTIVKAGKNPAEQAHAAQSFHEALKIAPWWPDAWYNLAVAQELAGQFDAAEKSFRFYILGSPGEAEQRDAQDRLYALAAKRKLSGGK